MANFGILRSPMKSMTGHGRGESRSPSWAVVVECHSVNRKSLEVVVHGERPPRMPEPQMREAVHRRLSRGRVQINVGVQKISAQPGPCINREAAEAFAREARALKEFLNLAGELTLAEVLAAPGVCRAAEDGGDEITDLILNALEAALDGLEVSRTAEGLALKEILKTQAGGLHSILEQIATLAPETVSSHRKNLLHRIAQAGIPLETDNPRLLTEIALFAERSDVAEEIDRARIHASQLQLKLEDTRPVGRTLEFLAQELGREFNTIASKSQSAAMAALVIEAKTGLDRIREQTANIE